MDSQITWMGVGDETIGDCKAHTLWTTMQMDGIGYLLKMPPSSEALRHSGGERRLFTSAIFTLYLEVELRRDSLPGTEQNRSVGFTTHVPPVATTHNTHITLLTHRHDTTWEHTRCTHWCTLTISENA